jgi:hypothetical protein
MVGFPFIHPIQNLKKEAFLFLVVLKSEETHCLRFVQKPRYDRVQALSELGVELLLVTGGIRSAAAAAIDRVARSVATAACAVQIRVY